MTTTKIKYLLTNISLLLSHIFTPTAIFSWLQTWNFMDNDDGVFEFEPKSKAQVTQIFRICMNMNITKNCKTKREKERDRETEMQRESHNLDLSFNLLHLYSNQSLQWSPAWNSTMDCCISLIKVLGITVGIIPTCLRETHTVWSHKPPQLRPHLVEDMSPATLVVAPQNDSLLLIHFQIFGESWLSGKDPSPAQVPPFPHGTTSKFPHWWQWLWSGEPPGWWRRTYGLYFEWEGRQPPAQALLLWVCVWDWKPIGLEALENGAHGGSSQAEDEEDEEGEKMRKNAGGDVNRKEEGREGEM